MAFNKGLLSINKCESYEGVYLVDGYYDSKYFALDIDEIFGSSTTETGCTDNELRGIILYLRENVLFELK